MGARAKRDLAVEQNRELVLSPPQHYHVGVFVYRNVNQDGVNFDFSTYVERISNDVRLAESDARKHARYDQGFSFTREIRQCADAEHLKGLDLNGSEDREASN